MSKEITEWIKYELYPTLFHSIDTALPEHSFKLHTGSWRSKTYIDGSPHKSRQDKTVVSKKAPGIILEQGGDTLSLVDYVMRRDRVEFIQAVKTLADTVGLQLPKGEFNSDNYQRYKDQATLLEDCNSYFTYCLQNATGSDEVRTYLLSRGYLDEDVKAMELGYISGQDKLIKHLLSKGYSQSLIDEVIKLHNGIGSTHTLTIPYRSGGSIKGFIVRTIEKAEPKYLVSTGLRRGESFFNITALKGDKDLIVVEGYLDALVPQAKGVENVVALGGAAITKDQVKDAIRKGAKSFTLFLDTDEAGKKGVNQALEVILGERVNKVYIVNLPDVGEGKIDPDRLIKEKGVDAFKEAIKAALPYYEYQLQETINKYGRIEDETGKLQPKDIDNLLQEVIETASRIPNAIDKDRYKKLFISLDAIKELGISEESWAITVDKLTTTRDKEAQDKDYKKTISEANKLHDNGETDKALEYLNSNIKEIKLKDKATEFSRLLLPTSEAHIKAELKTTPRDLNTGFTIKGDELLLTGGALTVYAAPTGHGKTVFTINTIINVAEAYPDSKFIFFTYEESDNSIIQYFLNTYIDTDLNSSTSPKSNRRLIKDYFKTGSTQYINSKNLDYFKVKKEEFFKTYIEPGRILIKYVDYRSSELDLAIRYLQKTEPKLGGVFIDYFQLLNLPGDKKREERVNSRQEELKIICRELKELAKDTWLPICIAAQFNRDVTDLMKLHPTKIGEAGDIERIVHTLVGLWDISKNTVAKETTTGEANEAKTRVGGAETGMYIELLKSRDLPTGSYEVLDYNGKTGKIKNNESSIKDPFK